MMCMYYCLEICSTSKVGYAHWRFLIKPIFCVQIKMKQIHVVSMWQLAKWLHVEITKLMVYRFFSFFCNLKHCLQTSWWWFRTQLPRVPDIRSIFILFAGACVYIKTLSVQRCRIFILSLIWIAPSFGCL